MCPWTSCHTEHTEGAGRVESKASGRTVPWEGPGTCLLPPLHLGLTLIVSLPFLSHGHHPLPESPPYHVAVGVGIWGGASGLQK